MAKVKVYSTESCPYCHMVKKFLDDMNIKYEAVDVGNDQAAAEEMINKSGQMGVPVVDIDGKIIVGFNKGEITRTLGLK